jgi:hypothetical protein
MVESTAVVSTVSVSTVSVSTVSVVTELLLELELLSVEPELSVAPESSGVVSHAVIKNSIANRLTNFVRILSLPSVGKWSC